MPRPSGLDAYAETFVARHAGPGAPVPGAPGLHGVRLSGDPSSVRLLVTDDRAVDELAALLPTVRTGRIAVLAHAVRCTELVEDHLGWTSTTSTAMARPDLRSVPAAALPRGLARRPVQESSDGAPGSVPLDEAVAVAVAADPDAGETAGVLARGLRSLMPAFQLMAAVDRNGTVRATSGAGVFEHRAVVIFVNTDPGWRRRGVGRAMTAAALEAARARGASQACLDASDSGLPVYRGLGFDVLGRTRRFSSPL